MGNAMIFGGARMSLPSNGLPLSSLIEGQIVMIPENGVLAPFYLACHDYESGLNGTGRVLFIRKDCYESRAWHSSQNNAYATSDLDSWFNGTYKALMDSAMQEAVGTTTFYYTPSGTNMNVTTLSRSVFALSVTEFGLSHASANVEGSALPIAATLKVAYLDGSATYQWTRSPYLNGTPCAFPIGNDGNAKGVVSTTNPYGVRPCFTLPSTILVETEPNADGSVNLMI